MDHHFDGIPFTRSGNLEGLQRVFQFEMVGYQRFQINFPACHQTQSSGITEKYTNQQTYYKNLCLLIAVSKAATNVHFLALCCKHWQVHVSGLHSHQHHYALFLCSLRKVLFIRRVRAKTSLHLETCRLYLLVCRFERNFLTQYSLHKLPALLQTCPKSFLRLIARRRWYLFLHRSQLLTSQQCSDESQLGLLEK